MKCILILGLYIKIYLFNLYNYFLQRSFIVYNHTNIINYGVLTMIECTTTILTQEKTSGEVGIRKSNSSTLGER